MLPLPTPPETPNETAIARWKKETNTSVTGTTMKTSVNYVTGFEFVFVNGALKQAPSDYSLSGVTITFTGSLTAAVVTIAGWFRAS